METSAAPVCHLVLMWIRSDMFSSLVIISWDNFLIKEWSIFERAILQKNSVKNAVHIIPSFVIHYCSSVILDIAEFWNGFETAITLTMQKKENLIQLIIAHQNIDFRQIYFLEHCSSDQPLDLRVNLDCMCQFSSFLLLLPYLPSGEV